VTIERKDLSFILSHFELPTFLRRISTALSEDRQYPAYSIEFMLYKFQEAKEKDCKVNAYRYIGGNSSEIKKSSNENNGNGKQSFNKKTNTYYSWH
jgi:hypothetical protein